MGVRGQCVRNSRLRTLPLRIFFILSGLACRQSLRGRAARNGAKSTFKDRTKFAGIRFIHEYPSTQQGWAEDESSANQEHFTNSAPAIADIDSDGKHELVVLASVQNVSQDDRPRGVALWILNGDGTRKAPWIEPFHVSRYLAGLWDFEGTNDPQKSLTFLKKDLESNVGSSGRPVIIVRHLDVAPPDDWWTAADRETYYNAIKKYNVALIIFGHTGTKLGEWNGIRYLNDGNLGKGFFVVNIKGDRMVIAQREKGCVGQTQWHLPHQNRASLMR